MRRQVEALGLEPRTVCATWSLSLPSSRGKSLCCPKCCLRFIGWGPATRVLPLAPLQLGHSPLQGGPEQTPSGTLQPALAPGGLSACRLPPPMAGAPRLWACGHNLGKNFPSSWYQIFPRSFLPWFLAGALGPRTAGTFQPLSCGRRRARNTVPSLGLPPGARTGGEHM